MSHSIRSRSACAAWGAVVGFTLTIVGCIVLGLTLGIIAMISNPNDPGAGSVAEIGALAIPLLSPVGAIVGAICGWIRAARRVHRAS